jgi:hypothetical protein
MDNISEDIIRDADPVICEQLLEDDRSDFEKEIDIVMNLSYEEFKNTNEANKKFEADIIEQYNKELLERKTKCNEIIFNMNKISKFDKDIKEIYEIIEPILELYCSQNINYCVFDEVTHNRIFYMISKIRIDKKNIEFLKTIIIKEDKISVKIN